MKLRAFILLSLGLVCQLGHAQPTMPFGFFKTSAATSSYEGLIATRVRMSDTPNSDRYSMSRSGHFATQNISALKLVIPNFWNSGYAGPGQLADVGPGASASVTASIEYPAGTFTQVLFSGIATGTIANGSYLVSDSTSVSIPDATQFWVRIWRDCTSGGVYSYPAYSAALGDMIVTSTTALTDQTMGGTIPNTGFFYFPPLAIIGQTVKSSVIIVGDSIAAGYADSEAGNAQPYDGKRGVIARSLGSLPFLNLSVSGEAPTSFLSNGNQRKLLMGYASHVICNLGTNDLNGGQSSAAVITALQNIYALVPVGRKIYQTTITTKTSSSDAWATTVNQTNTEAAAVATFNTAVRAGLSGVTGFIDIRPVLESVSGSGLWPVSGGAKTGDGLHPNVAGYALVESSGVIDPNAFVWP